jgi:hypothetical protein
MALGHCNVSGEQPLDDRSHMRVVLGPAEQRQMAREERFEFRLERPQRLHVHPWTFLNTDAPVPSTDFG